MGQMDIITAKPLEDMCNSRRRNRTHTKKTSTRSQFYEQMGITWLRVLYVSASEEKIIS